MVIRQFFATIGRSGTAVILIMFFAWQGFAFGGFGIHPGPNYIFTMESDEVIFPEDELNLEEGVKIYRVGMPEATK